MRSIKLIRARLLGVSVLFLLFAQAHSEPPKTKNVFLIVSDGLRWQEVFGGAEEELLTKEDGGVKDTNAIRAQFWAPTPEARREALLPFIWGKIGRQGQIFGNQKKGSIAQVTNGKKFSYPGYNEMLTGFADPSIDSNDKRANTNITVFEWLNARSAFRGHCAVFGSWDVFPYIFNCERSRLPIWPGWEKKFTREEISVAPGIIEFMRDTTPIWGDLTYDSFLYHAVNDYLPKQKPRVLFVGFGETDEWAHAGRYDLYLTSAHHVDKFIQKLWQTVQSTPEYRGQTSLIITADHGRGSGLSEWKGHGAKVDGSEGIWIAVIGPDTPALGERVNIPAVSQNQIAATIAALLGENYHVAFPSAGPPITRILGMERQ